MYVLAGEGTFYLTRGVDHTIGKKPDCSVLLKAEVKHGISRLHGVISYKQNEELTYTDSSSFGTIVNNKKVLKKTVVLRAGDIVRFGSHPAQWSLSRCQVVPSSLSSSVRTELVKTCKALDVGYSTVWSELSTTLVMSKLAVTAKVLSAVAERRSIVTPDFLSQCLTALRDSKPCPKVTSPPITDKALRSIDFQCRAERRDVFSELVFVFLSEKERKALEKVVLCTGGTCTLLDPLQPDRREILLSEFSVVVDTDNAAMSSMARKVLTERNLLPVTQAEITLAILYCDKHRLYKRADDSVNYSALMVESQACTQAMTQALPDQAMPNQAMPDIRSNTPAVPKSEAKPKDISFLEPSYIPPKLDRTSKSILESPAAKNTSFIELSNVPLRLDKTCASPATKETTDTLASPANTSKSFFEPSNVPPRLDKTSTLASPQGTLSKTPSNTSTLSKTPSYTFLEPSHCPPRLDRTLNTPLRSSGPSSEAVQHSTSATPSTEAVQHSTSATPSTEAVQHSTSATPSTEAVQHSTSATPSTEAVQHSTSATPSTEAVQHSTSATPSTEAVQHNTSATPSTTINGSRSYLEPTNADISRSDTPNTSNFKLPDMDTSCASLFSSTPSSTPAHTSASTTRTALPKRALTLDSSSSDEDSNPFSRACSKRSKLSQSASVISQSASVISPSTSVISPSTSVISPSASVISPSASVISATVIKSEDFSPAPSPPSHNEMSATTTTQPNPDEPLPYPVVPRVKRELIEKESSLAKRCKTEDVKPPPNVIKIAEQSAGWISHSHSVTLTEHAFSNLTVTDFSVTVLTRDSAHSNSNHGNSASQPSNSQNFKRFKRKGPVQRSATITLSEAAFQEEEEGGGGWFKSQTVTSQVAISQAAFDVQDQLAEQHTLIEEDSQPSLNFRRGPARKR